MRCGCSEEGCFSVWVLFCHLLLLDHLLLIKDAFPGIKAHSHRADTCFLWFLRASNSLRSQADVNPEKMLFGTVSCFLLKTKLIAS